MTPMARQQISALNEALHALSSAKDALDPVETTRPFLAELSRDIGAKITGIHEEIGDIIMEGK